MGACRLFIVAFASAVVLACGSDAKHDSGGQAGPTGSPAAPATNRADETSKAQGMLLTIHDFPSGWSEQPRVESGDDIFDQCGEEDFLKPGLTGLARTGEFSQGSAAEIWQTLRIYESPAAAETAVRESTKAEIFNCVLARINRGQIDNNDWQYREASFGPISFPKISDQTIAIRLQMTAKARRPALISTAEVYIDAVYVRKGRVGFLVAGIDVLSPIPHEQIETLVRKAEAKVPVSP
jgi:hypothetical protein